jgi:glycosyltransferase involved in cell wall biosynthesis
MRTIRVGLDLTGSWRQQTGIFRYAAEVAKHLLLLQNTEPQVRYVLFFAREVHPDFVPLQDVFDTVICPTTNELLIKQLWFPSVLPQFRLDVMHYPTFPPPYIQPFGPRTVMTFYDTGPWRYPGTLTLRGRLYFRTLLSRGIRTCTHVITLSSHAKSEIGHFFGAHVLSKVSVVPGAVQAKFAVPYSDSFKKEVQARYGLPERFFFTVSTVEPRKNLVTLLDAYMLLKKHHDASCPPLVIVGRKGWNCDDILKYMTELEGAVRFPGYVSDEELIALYQMATCLVFPSLYEGFGLPVLEAMAAGCPVITSTTSSLPEVAGNAGLLVDPLNAEEIAAAMQKVLQDRELRARMIPNGRAWASCFSWEKAAQMTREVYIAASY